MSFLNKTKEFFGFKTESEEENNGKFEELQPQAIKPFRAALLHGQHNSRYIPAEIKVEEPRVYEDSLNIATFLRENKPVIVNLKYLDKESSKRLIDFVCGTAYAINGHMMKIGENIFLFTPASVLIADSNEKTTFQQGVEQEEKEVFFKKMSK